MVLRKNLRLHVTPQFTSFIHFEFAVFQRAEAIANWLVDKMIELSHFNLHQCLLLPLLLCGRVLHLLVRRCHISIEHSEVDAVLLLGQFPRLPHIVQQSDVGAPRYVLDCLLIRRVVHQLVERFLHIVMLELLPLLRVVRDVLSDIRRRLEAYR